MKNVNSVKNNAEPPKTSFPPAATLARKGLGSIDDTTAPARDNILFDIARAFHSREKTSLQAHRIRLKAIQGLSHEALKVEKEVAEVLKHLDKTQKIQPLLDAGKTIAKSFSAAVNAAIGFELLSVGAPILSSVFLSSAVLSGADLSGFFKDSDYKAYLDGFTIASSAAAVGIGNYANALTEIGTKAFYNAFFLLNSVITAGNSFYQSEQDRCKAEYLGLQDLHKRIEFSLNSFLKEVEQSFESEEKVKREIQGILLANRNLE